MCHLFKESSPAPMSLLKSLPAALSRPEDNFGIQAGRDSAVGKDFSKDLGAGLDSLNKITSNIYHHACTVS